MALTQHDGSYTTQINYALEQVLMHKFGNAYVLVDAIRGTLERFSILMPPLTEELTGNDQDFTFKIEQEQIGTGEEEELPLFLHIIIERDVRGHYLGFAQIVDEEELDMLLYYDEHHDLGEELDVGEDQIVATTSNYLRQTRRSADD